MSIGTPVLYNAAVGGFIQGIQSQRKGSNAVPANYASIAAAAVVFAASFDAALTASANAAITTLLPKLASAGATVPNTTAAQTNAAASSVGILAGLVASWFQTSSLSGTAADTTTATYNAAVADILSSFTEYQANASLV